MAKQVTKCEVQGCSKSGTKIIFYETHFEGETRKGRSAMVCKKHYNEVNQTAKPLNITIGSIVLNPNIIHN